MPSQKELEHLEIKYVYICSDNCGFWCVTEFPPDHSEMEWAKCPWCGDYLEEMED